MKCLSLALLVATLGTGCQSLMSDRSPASTSQDGNGLKEDAEPCDGSPGCSAAGRLEECGNGISDPGEECDNGAANDDTGDCTRACKKAICGDGLVKTRASGSPDGGVDPTLERCDDGNKENGDGCNPQCTMLGRVTVIGGEAGGMGIADGVGSGARLANVYALAARRDEVYFSETGSCRIRSLYVPTGKVSTVAGVANECHVLRDGPADKATFSRAAMPMVRVGSDLYVGQAGSLRKLALDQDNQPVSTCLEQPASQFVAMASDPNQSTVLYVAEPQALYKMDLPCDCSARTCNLKLLAGNKDAASAAIDGPGSTARFVAIQSLAFNSRDNLLYIGERGSLRAMDLATGAVFTVAGNASTPGHDDGAGKDARVGDIRGLAQVGDSLYFTEQEIDSTERATVSLGWGNLRRMSLVSSMEIATVAGTHGTISTLDAGESDGFSSFARFVNPGPLALVGDETTGLLILGEQASLRAHALGSTPGMVTTAAGVLEKDLSYHRVTSAAAHNGNLYVANRFGDLTRVPMASSRPLEVSQNCEADVHVPVALAISGSTLFVADASTALDGVCAIDLSPEAQSPRMVLSKIGLKDWGTRGGVTGMAVDAEAVYFASRADRTIRRADRATGLVTVMTVAHPLVSPWGLAMVDGDLVVTLMESNLVLRINVKTGAAQPIGTGMAQTVDSAADNATAAAFCHPTALAWDPARRQLFVAETHCAPAGDPQGHAIRQIDWASGNVTTLLGPGPRPYLKEGTGALAGVNWVGALTFDDRTKSLYAADTWENVLLKIE